MKVWARTVSILGVLWLLTRWLGAGSLFAPDARTVALWAAVLLACFLLWRDGRPLLARYGFARQDTPLAILEQRLAKGELDLDAYRALRDELLSPAGIQRQSENRKSKRMHGSG